VGVLVWVALASLLATLLFLYRFLEEVADGNRPDWRPIFINEATAIAGLACLLAWAVLPWMHRHRLTKASLRTQLPWYLVMLLLFSATHTSLNWGLRTLLYRIAGLGEFRYGDMPTRYFMEFPLDALAIGLATIIAHLLWSAAEATQRELRAEQLERTLTQTRLQALQVQLQPHFLFNALNTVSSVMYEDVSRADRILGNLSALLRASLGGRDTQEVPLEVELATLEHYLEILRARYGDRCQVEVDVPEQVRKAQVPAVLLQPLVENAVRHGSLERTGQGAIRVKGWRDGGTLTLEVWDDGAGLGGGVSGHGLGLGATRDRLHLLYGDSQSVTAGGHGTEYVVTLRMPYREGPNA
jgi:signal transduction histidine kinase